MKELNWLDRVKAITEKPKVTIARYHAFNLTHAKPIKKPIPADKTPPIRMTRTWIAADKAPRGIELIPNIWIRALVILLPIIAEAKPPMPKKAACPSEP